MNAFLFIDASHVHRMKTYLESDEFKGPKTEILKITLMNRIKLKKSMRVFSLKTEDEMGLMQYLFSKQFLSRSIVRCLPVKGHYDTAIEVVKNAMAASFPSPADSADASITLRLNLLPKPM